MQYPSPEGTQTLKSVEPNPAVSKSSQPGFFQCMIVSQDTVRCGLLRQAAEDSDWETIVCTDAETAMLVAVRSLLQLAIVDLESADGQRPRGFDPLLQQLAQTSDVLLIACGNDGNIQEEIWARQLGVWLYLPAVIDLDGMTTMCDEARQIADRRVAFS